MKIVINTCFGGFGISDDFAKELGLPSHINKYDNKVWYNYDRDDLRTDPRVIEALEIGRDINGPSADLKVVEVPDDVQWHIEEYDGLEHVAENHRTWG